MRQAPPGRKSMSQVETTYLRGPHQRDMCSQELCASKTRSRGASKTRVITISLSVGVVTSSLLPLAAISLLLSLELVQVFVEPVVALLPELPVLLGPLGDLFQGAGLEPGRA